MVTSLLAATLLTSFAPSALVCPYLGEAVGANSKGYEYNGVLYRVCCSSCGSKILSDPKSAVASATGKKLIAGEFLFDPITRTRIQKKANTAFSDFESVRYYFSTSENKETFEKNPKRYGTLPTFESPMDAMTKNALTSYSQTSGYIDYRGVRVYYTLGQKAEISNGDLETMAKEAAMKKSEPKVFVAPKAEPSKSNGQVPR